MRGRPHRQPAALKPLSDVVKGLSVSSGTVYVYHDLQRNRALLGYSPPSSNQICC
jgi:hypothetical protein